MNSKLWLLEVSDKNALPFSLEELLNMKKVTPHFIGSIQFSCNLDAKINRQSSQQHDQSRKNNFQSNEKISYSPQISNSNIDSSGKKPRQIQPIQLRNSHQIQPQITPRMNNFTGNDNRQSNLSQTQKPFKSVELRNSSQKNFQDSKRNINTNILKESSKNLHKKNQLSGSIGGVQIVTQDYSNVLKSINRTPGSVKQENRRKNIHSLEKKSQPYKKQYENEKYIPPKIEIFSIRNRLQNSKQIPRNSNVRNNRTKIQLTRNLYQEKQRISMFSCY